MKNYSVGKIVRHIVFGVIISFLIIFVVVQFGLGFNYCQFFDSFSKIQWIWILVALCANIFSFFLEGSQLYVLARTMGRKPSFWRSLQLFFIYNFFSYALPSTSGGMPFQIYFLKDDGLTIAEGTVLSMMRGFISIIVRVFFVLVIVITMLFGFRLGLPVIFNLLFYITLLGFLLIVVLGAIVFLNPQMFTFAVKFFGKFAWVRKISKLESQEEFTKKGRHYLLEIKITAELMLKCSKSNFVFAVLLSSLSWIMLKLIPFFVLLALNESPNFFAVFALGVLAQMATAWFPTPGAVGAVEMGMGSFYLLMRYPENIGLFILFYRIADYYCDLLFGAPISLALLLKKFGKGSKNKEINLNAIHINDQFEELKENKIIDCEDKLDRECTKSVDKAEQNLVLELIHKDVLK